MIDLTNTCVLVRTKEENEKLLKEAEKQGFHWVGRSDCKPLQQQHFPDILSLFNDKNMIYVACINSNSAFHEASELLGEKEMTAREFVEWYSELNSLCNKNKLKCQECVLYMRNTKCRSSLCNISDWKENIDKILEIAKSGNFTVPTPEEKAIEDIEKLIQIPDHEIKITDEIKESLKLAVEKLKEVNDGEINRKICSK